jgi:hypothetical protein
VVIQQMCIGDAEASIIAIFGPSVGENGLEMIDMSGEAPWNELQRKS